MDNSTFFAFMYAWVILGFMCAFLLVATAPITLEFKRKIVLDKNILTVFGVFLLAPFVIIVGFVLVLIGEYSSD